MATSSFASRHQKTRPHHASLKSQISPLLYCLDMLISNWNKTAWFIIDGSSQRGLPWSRLSKMLWTRAARDGERGSELGGNRTDVHQFMDRRRRCSCMASKFAPRLSSGGCRAIPVVFGWTRTSDRRSPRGSVAVGDMTSPNRPVAAPTRAAIPVTVGTRGHFGGRLDRQQPARPSQSNPAATRKHRRDVGVRPRLCLRAEPGCAGHRGWQRGCA